MIEQQELPRQCALCGDSERVKVGLVCWTDTGEFSAMPRCLNVVACRSRVEGSGSPWGITDPVTPEPYKPPQATLPKSRIIEYLNLSAKQSRIVTDHLWRPES